MMTMHVESLKLIYSYTYILWVNKTHVLLCNRHGNEIMRTYKLFFLTSLVVIACSELHSLSRLCRRPSRNKSGGVRVPCPVEASTKPTLCHFGYVMTNKDEKLDCSRQSCSVPVLWVFLHLPRGAEPFAFKKQNGTLTSIESNTMPSQKALLQIPLSIVGV